MYVDLVCVGFLLTVCGGIAWIGSLAAREAREESRAAHERRREKERLLKGQVWPVSLPSHLTPAGCLFRPASTQMCYCLSSRGILQFLLGCLRSGAAQAPETCCGGGVRPLAQHFQWTSQKCADFAMRVLGCVLQVCDLETALTIERARAEEADKAAAKAERRMQVAVREVR